MVVSEVMALADTEVTVMEATALVDTEVTALADMEVTVMDTNTYSPLAWIITRLNTITESACGVRLTKTHILAAITTKKTMEKLPRLSINCFLTMLLLFFMFFQKEINHG